MRCNINNNSDFDISEIEDLLQDLFSFSQNRHGFKKPVTLNLMSDESNTSPLGKTAHYDPSSMEIAVYVDGRHPKDIMRSFSHELVHHNQNENGMFDNIAGESGDGYAQSNPHLRKMEKEAYLKGNMCFRDWEDGYKSSNPNILNERRIYKMSTKDWKDKELNGLLNERWGFSMNLDKLNEGSCGSHKKDDEEPLEEEEKNKDSDGDGLTDKQEKLPAGLQKAIAKKKGLDLKEEEEVNEISIRNSLGGGDAPKSDKEAAAEIQKGAKKIHTPKTPLSKAQTPNLKKEGKVEDMSLEQVHSFLEMLKDMGKIKEDDIAEVAEKLEGKKEKENKDPKEAKLREAIRRIIKKQLRK